MVWKVFCQQEQKTCLPWPLPSLPSSAQLSQPPWHRAWHWKQELCTTCSRRFLQPLLLPPQRPLCRRKPLHLVILLHFFAANYLWFLRLLILRSPLSPAEVFLVSATTLGGVGVLLVEEHLHHREVVQLRSLQRTSPWRWSSTGVRCRWWQRSQWKDPCFLQSRNWGCQLFYITPMFVISLFFVHVFVCVFSPNWSCRTRSSWHPLWSWWSRSGPVQSRLQPGRSFEDWIHSILNISYFPI